MHLQLGDSYCINFLARFWQLCLMQLTPFVGIEMFQAFLRPFSIHISPELLLGEFAFFSYKS
jgi:hypothetical protein